MLDSLPRALEVGYVGTSHKNCKGVFKGVANACLLSMLNRRQEEAGYLLTAEDLSNVGPVALLQDLAVVSQLGPGHAERNGHHYFRGLAALPADLARAKAGILAKLEAAPLADQEDFAELGAGDRLGALLDDMVGAGELVRISGGIYASAVRLAAMKERLRAHFAAVPELTASQARELLETNRKYVIPFLEFLDAQGFTRRHGDVRVLLGRAESVPHV